MRIFPILAAAVLACGSGFAEEAKVPVPASPAPAKEETLVIEKAPLVLLSEADGALDAVRREKLKYIPREYQGALVVVEAIPNGQRVEESAVVLRFDAAPLERALRAAQEELEGLKVRLGSAREEHLTLKAANKLKMERLGLDLAQAQRDLDAFKKYGEEKMLKGKALSVKSNENRVDDQKEELTQLEKMYKDSQLAGETKEIVLERTRRNTALALQFLDLNRKDEKATHEFEHPMKRDQVQQALDFKKRDVELAEIGNRLAEVAKAEDLKRSERQVRDAEEKVARLEHDLKQLVFKAPCKGILQARGMEAGDKANPWSVLAEVLDTDKFKVNFALKPADLEGLKPGEKVNVRLPDRPEKELDGKILEISGVPAPEGADKGGARYAVSAVLDSHSGLLPGMKARVEISRGTLKDVISVPREAIAEKDGRTWCRVRTGEKVERREVVLGPGNRERVQVLKGLSEKDTVVVKEGSPK